MSWFARVAFWFAFVILVYFISLCIASAFDVILLKPVQKMCERALARMSDLLQV